MTKHLFYLILGNCSLDVLATTERNNNPNNGSLSVQEIILQMHLNYVPQNVMAPWRGSEKECSIEEKGT